MTIPRRIFRVIPHDTTTEVEKWWDDACRLHSGWEHRTYRDPIDPTDFPNTSPVWDRCGSGAQLAGLIRLEAAWNHGGIYLDSDLEVLRPLNPLLAPPMWATWEDAQTVPDFVFGAEAKHPVIGGLMAAAVEAVKHGGGAWITGPGVFTDMLPGRDDVLLLAPGSFAPIHYVGKLDADWSNLRHRFPFSYGAHHWRHSWATS